ncbi:DEAD/DEAH box helicase family protein [Aliarcobacter butzleri]|uniref:DEAD/DEAH box helicase n=1 Tax=Aliarcobacter butzleri TaxID=28197 RepID=UPI00344E0D70
MQLKIYQSEAINSLEFFCEEYSKTGLIEQSFKATRAQFELPNIPYAEYNNLNVPSVCFRIPTGGGKTLLAVHSIPVIVNKLLNVDSSLIFWLAPSEAIIDQTIKALKDPQHHFNQFLSQKFKGRDLNIMSIAEAHSKAFDLSTELPIIVATIQTFSRESDENLKFYDQNGVYQDFLKNTNETPSLANAIKQSNPIIIMDEAHNAKTDLRVSKLIELDPCFILELTATPQLKHNEAAGEYASNILYSVSASQLKAEDMIKLPIILETINKWQLAIKEAIEKRTELEALAKLELTETGQYIRPVILFKAESKRGSNPITYEKILEVLLTDYGIPREEIAVHTGEHQDLKNVDLMDKTCKIKYVITVDKLKEGWDAPFAYILSAVGDMRSSTAVEQILGRVLRLPYAKRKAQEDLEKAYAFIASEETTEVIKNLKDSLVDNGFEELEAQIHISASANSNNVANEVLTGLFAETTRVLETFDIEAVPDKFKENINYNKDTKEFSILKPISQKQQEEFSTAIKQAVSKESDIAALEEIVQERTLTLSNYNKSFSIPKLLANSSGGLFEFDKSILLQGISWSDQEIAKHAKLSETDFSITVRKDLTEIDITDKQKIQIRKLEDNKENLFSLNGESLKLNDKDITRLIFQQINTQELQTLNSNKLVKFIHLIVLDLLENRGFTTIDLKANLHLLTESIFYKIKNLQNGIIKNHFDSLFNDTSFFHVDPTKVFTFDPNNYPTPSPIKDIGQFKKHYYKLIDKMNGEETKFAEWIETLPEVDFWVRNIERNPKHSFWLQTSTDKFYPDFIIKLKSGKILVVEYKGEHLKNEDTKEKEMLGLAWANLTDNADFAMVYKSDFKDKIKAILN